MLLLAPLVALTLGLDGYPNWNEAETAAACRKKEAPPACAKRLRDLLRAELKREKLKLAVSFLGCKGPATAAGTCADPRSYDGCTPFAALLIDSLGRLGRDASAAMSELDEALQRIPQHRPQTEIARAAAGAVDALDEAAAQLSSENYDCRGHALAMLEASHTQQSCARLAAFAATGPWTDQQSTAIALTACGADGVDGLQALLERPLPPFALIVAVRALAAAGNGAQPAAKRLTTLAEQHWSLDVRQAAAKAASTLSKTKVVARPRSCLVSDGGPQDVRRADGFARPDDACTRKSAVALSVDGVCIEGFDGGEWGGVLKADGIEFARNPLTNPRRIVQMGRHVYVLQGMTHMGSHRGDLSEVLHDARGWRLEWVTELPGAARVLWLDAEGQLMMQTEDDSERPCPQGMVIRFAPGERTFEVLR